MKALALLLLLLLLTATTTLAAAPISLFDGKTLDGWSAREGEEKWWRVQDGALTGGSLEAKVPRNTFLVSNRKFENFELTYQIRLVKGEGFLNSGLQIRSIRKPGGHEMIGYQVDAGIGYWGDLYDKSRRAKLTGPVDPEAQGLNKPVTIASHQIAKRSLMPEGLIDGYSDDQVRDLFAYLLSLK